MQKLADERLIPGQTVKVTLRPVTSDNLTIQLLESNSDRHVQLNALEVLAAVTPGEVEQLVAMASPSPEGADFVGVAERKATSVECQEVNIRADRPGPGISPMLYGLFFEELSRAGDGGLYAEMVRNRDFESVQLPMGGRIENKCLVTPWFRFNQNDELYPRNEKGDLPWWSVIAEGGAQVTAALDEQEPLHANNPRSMRVEVRAAGRRAGVANEGYWGMAVKDGERYDLRFYARSAEGYRGRITAAIESADGKTVYAQMSVRGIGQRWKRHHAVLHAHGVDAKARLVLAFSEPGTVWLDIVSLFPRHTYKNRPNGMRADIAQMLADLRPAFMRFPGGGYANGISTVDRFQWNKSIGPLPQRPGNWNRWGYHVTTGMGYHEFLQFCEDIGAEPIFVAWPGVSAGAGDFAVGRDALQPYVQEMLDAVEYANGSVTTRWGAERAKNGHRQPFRLKYIEIGNEDSGPAYVENFRIMSAALKARYPEIQTIATCPVGDAKVDIVDEHWYGRPDAILESAISMIATNARGQESLLANTPPTQGESRRPVAEAADLIGFERNSDLVTMACYAPLLQNRDRADWGPNLIVFDTARCYGGSSYYLQKMFNFNRPDFTVETRAAASDSPILPAGLFGVGTKSAAAEFKNLQVRRNDQLLFRQNAAVTKAGTNVTGGGAWLLKRDVLRQSDPRGHGCWLFGAPEWSDYALTLQARITDGDGGLFVAFRSDETGEGFQLRWHLTAEGQSRLEDYGVRMLGLEAKPFQFEKGRWYELRVQLSGAEVKCFLDGRLMHTAVVEQLRVPRFFATSGWDEKRGQLVIKLANGMDIAQKARLRIEGMRKLDSRAELITLSAAAPTEENSLEQPMKIVPITSKLDGFGPRYELPMRPWSVAILRVGGEKGQR